MTALLRLPDVVARFGSGSRSGVYRAVAAGVLPPPVACGLNAVAWPSGEIEQILELRAAGGTHDEVRQLVRRLVQARADRKAALLAEVQA